MVFAILFFLLLHSPAAAAAVTSCKQLGNDPATCDATQGCVFCKGGWANTHGCYTNDAASRLPPGMFQCDSSSTSDKKNDTSTSTAFPSGKIPLTFSCTTNQKCDVGFPGCAANMNQGYAIDMAINDQTFMETYGPTSMLPSTENNQIVNRWDTGLKYAMWISGKGTTKKIINCTRYNVTGIHMTRSRLRESFLGNSMKSTKSTSGQVACSLDSTRMGSCDAWTWVSTFGCGQKGASAVGREPEVWRVSSNNVLTAMTNDIYYPKVCQTSNPSHIGASADYTENWSPTPDPSLFDVPADGDCPMVSDWNAFVKSVHPSLRLVLAREGVRAGGV